MRSLANPKSRVSKFYTGDITTLLTDEKGEKVQSVRFSLSSPSFLDRSYY